MEGMLREIMTPHWIASEMERCGYTAQGLAADMRVTDRVVSCWRKGTRRPSLESAEKLLECFGYEVEVHRVKAEG